MEVVRAVPVVLLAAGVTCLAWAAAHGGATFGAFVIFPFVVGYGLLPLAGGFLILAGLATLSLAFPAPELVRAAERRSTGDRPGGTGAGGVILIGPFPLFFGTWRSAPRWVYWVAVVAGLVLLLAVVLWVGGWALR